MVGQIESASYRLLTLYVDGTCYRFYEADQFRLQQCRGALGELRSAVKANVRWAYKTLCDLVLSLVSPAVTLSCSVLSGRAAVLIARLWLLPVHSYSRDFALAEPSAWKLRSRIFPRLAPLVIRSLKCHLFRSASLKSKLKQPLSSLPVASPHLIFLIAFTLSELILFIYCCACLLSTSSSSPGM